MFIHPARTTLETDVEKSDTHFGFTWIAADEAYRLRSSDNQFREVPEVVVDTLKEKASDVTVEELIEETAAEDAGAADVIREMHEEGFIREGDPVERLDPPAEIRLWPRAIVVGLLLCLAGFLWVDTLSGLMGPVLEQPFRYIIGEAHISVPLILGAVFIHEYGHHSAARRQGLDPEFGVSVINGVVPALITRTTGGWCLTRNRRMWITLAGPLYGFVVTLVLFALYYTVLPHPGLGIAAIMSFNSHFSVLIPVFHGDGYLLMTEILGEQNLRARGFADLEQRRPTWAAAYVIASYGFVVVGFTTNLLIGFLFGDYLGAAAMLGLTVAIYAESRLEIVDRLRTQFRPSANDR